jgi:hypothetical protein
MSKQILFFSCGFTAGRGSALKADTARPARTTAAAILSAERLSATRVGAIAYSVEGDTDTGDFEQPVILFSAGRVPADFGEG